MQPWPLKKIGKEPFGGSTRHARSALPPAVVLRDVLAAAGAMPASLHELPFAADS